MDAGQLQVLLSKLLDDKFKGQEETLTKRLDEQDEKFTKRLDEQDEKLNGLAQTLTKRLDEQDERMKRIERQVNKASLDLGTTFELTARRELSRRFGDNYVRKFEVSDLYGLGRLALPKDEGNGPDVKRQLHRACTLADTVSRSGLHKDLLPKLIEYLRAIATKEEFKDHSQKPPLNELSRGEPSSPGKAKGQEELSPGKVAHIAQFMAKITSKQALRNRLQRVSATATLLREFQGKKGKEGEPFMHGKLGFQAFSLMATSGLQPPALPYCHLLELDCRGRVTVHRTAGTITLITVEVAEIKRNNRGTAKAIKQLYLRLAVIGHAATILAPQARLYLVGRVCAPGHVDIENCRKSLKDKYPINIPGGDDVIIMAHEQL